jgi:hypothetical protein
MFTFPATAVFREHSDFVPVTRGDLRALAGAANGWSDGLFQTRARISRLSGKGFIKLKDGQAKITLKGRIIARLERAFDDYN